MYTQVPLNLGAAYAFLYVQYTSKVPQWISCPPLINECYSA